MRKGQPKSMGRTALYRIFNADGKLLYIGTTDNPHKRWQAHKWERPWWPEAVSKVLVWFETRVEAETAEKAAVAAESPLYNVADTPLHRRVTGFRSSLTAEERAFWAHATVYGARAAANDADA